MFTLEQINYYLNNFIIKDKKVFSKDKKVITEEDIILKVKTSNLIYNEARFSLHNDIKKYGNSKGNMDSYILKTMKKLSVNSENNYFEENKLINAILTSKGHYEEIVDNTDLNNSKFSIFYGLKKDYGLAYLRLKFRKKGLDISDINLKTVTLKNGLVKVILDYDLELIGIIFDKNSMKKNLKI